MKKGLLIIDVQNDYFEGGKCELFQPLEALEAMESVLRLFREKELPVIHVQHINTREGAAFFLPGTDGARIHKRLLPLEEEHRVIKHAPNSFSGTTLLKVIRETGITELVVCGMMSHMCVDTTVRACMDYGIPVTLLEDACTTKDLVFHGRTLPAQTVHSVFMASLNGMFAKVITTEELLRS